MSLYDYQVSLELSKIHPSFDALIMAAMRKADTNNAQLLVAAFPEIWDELSERYWSPKGLIAGEEQLNN